MINPGSAKFHCTECDYTTSHKYNWERHIKSTNHMFNNSTKTITQRSDKIQFTECHENTLPMFENENKVNEKSLGDWNNSKVIFKRIIK